MMLLVLLLHVPVLMVGLDLLLKVLFQKHISRFFSYFHPVSEE